MPDCKKCGISLVDGSTACGNCGTINARREKMPLGVGAVIGMLRTLVCWIVVVVVSAGSGAFPIGPVIAGQHAPCNPHSALRLFFISVFICCFAALAFGIFAARRGYPAVATILMLPAIGVLLQATLCTASLLSSKHC